MTNTKNIYVNGIISGIENIFDVAAKINHKQWHQVEISDIGRDTKKILKEWVENHKTYYYVKGERVDFELR